MSANQAGPMAILNVGRIVKALQHDRGWRENAGYALMVALDERVEGLRQMDLVSIIEYGGLVYAASLYLKSHPDDEYREELAERVISETVDLVNRTYHIELADDERELILKTVSACREAIIGAQ